MPARTTTGRRRPLTKVLATAAVFATAGVSAACSGDGAGGRAAASPLARIDTAAIAAPAPDSFRVAFETSKGTFVVEAHRAWAPRGVDRFYHLVRLGFYDETRFFRVLESFMAQFGMHGDPRVTTAWETLPIADDPVRESNLRGTVSFAMAGPNTRTTQLFINTVDNRNLDGMGFAPVGRVVAGLAVIDSLYAGYGEGAPSGFGPDQAVLAERGNAYLAERFPKLDFIRTARLVTP